MNAANKIATGSAEMELLWGAVEIGRAINRKPRQTFHMLEQGLLPARKVGNQWVAERGKLLEFFLSGLVAD